MSTRLEIASDPPTAHPEVELCRIDLRYQGHRIQDARLEGKLLASIAQVGVEEAVEGVAAAETFILLDGFKRFRCARKLQIPALPAVSLASNELGAIARLLQLSGRKPLNILEQAGFVDQLHQSGGMKPSEIAAQLRRSKAWVSMRLGLIQTLSPAVRQKLYAGQFPVYAYLYLARQFMRMNGVGSEDIDALVGALSGQNLSLREIEQLAHGFFRGPASFRQEILAGNLALALKQIREIPKDPDGCTEFERVFIGDLENLAKWMRRVMGKSQSPKLQSRPFFAQAFLLSATILSQLPTFQQTLQEFHDRSGKA